MECWDSGIVERWVPGPPKRRTLGSFGATGPAHWLRLGLRTSNFILHTSNFSRIGFVCTTVHRQPTSDYCPLASFHTIAPLTNPLDTPACSSLASFGIIVMDWNDGIVDSRRGAETRARGDAFPTPRPLRLRSGQALRLCARYNSGYCDKKNTTNTSPQSRENGNRPVGAGPRLPYPFGGERRGTTLHIRRRSSTPVCCAQIQTCTEILPPLGILEETQAGGDRQLLFHHRGPSAAFGRNQDLLAQDAENAKKAGPRSPYPLRSWRLGARQTQTEGKRGSPNKTRQGEQRAHPV